MYVILCLGIISIDEFLSASASAWLDLDFLHALQFLPLRLYIWEREVGHIIQIQ